MAEFRTERDSMGEMEVPAEALYGASTQRAVLNFPISGRGLPPLTHDRHSRVPARVIQLTPT